MGREKYILLLHFAKYLRFSKVQRTAKLLMFRSDFRKKRVCYESAIKTLYWNKLVVSECIFKLVCIVRVVDYQILIVHKRYC